MIDFVDLLRYAFFTFWFFLPAGIANMMPIFAARWPIIRKYDQPLDFGKTFQGHRIFGSHKTIRGIIVGIIFATLTLVLQVYLVRTFPQLRPLTLQIDYTSLPVLILGPLFGFGALAGDCIESFFKRRHGIKPGGGWFPFDQTDYIIGGAVATIPFVQLTLKQYVALVLMWLVLHVVASSIGYVLGLKERPV